MKKKKIDYSQRIRVGIVILFIFAFIILIDKQEENNLADINDSYFEYKTVEGKRLVVRDLNAIYPKYFVAFFDNTDNTYIIHSINYYQTDSQYELEFSNHLKYLVDYNYNNYMIRYVFDKGYGNYNYLINEISGIIDSNNYKIYW